MKNKSSLGLIVFIIGLSLVILNSLKLTPDGSSNIIFTVIGLGAATTGAGLYLTTKKEKKD